jgi:hypothetical protein
LADKDFKVKSGLDLGTPLPLTEGGTGQTSANNALNALLPVQTSSANKVLQTDGTSTSWVTLPNGYAKGDTASRPGSPALGDIYSNTQTGYIEVYTAAGWSQLGVIPLSATIGTATDVGTNRAYNNGAVSVTFTPNAGGGLASSFTATSTTGGYSASAGSSPIVVTGIPSNTSLTFTVTATNGYGNALASSASNSATVTTIPQAPTIGSVSSVANAAFGSTVSASVPVTANATGGKAVSGFTVTSSPGSLTGSGASPVTVAGLTSGTSYTFTAFATNENGNSLLSSESSSFTPSTVPQTPTIGTVTRTNNTTVSVPFTAGATGGSSITSYTVVSSPSISLSTSGTTSPVTVTGSFASATSYTFTIAAVNANGSSTASSASNSVTPFPIPTVTGGTLSSDATYYYRTFTSSGTLSVSTANLIADVLRVAGGGGGGPANYFSGGNYNYSGGGGGAGGVLYSSSQSIAPSSLTVTIGAGGAGRIDTENASGSNSTVTGFSDAIGGGVGGYAFATPIDGGGSGGGGVIYRGGSSVEKRNAGTGTVGQGNNGGDPGTTSTDPSFGTGGGGAGGLGIKGSRSGGNNGGIGVGSYSSWASATGTGSSGYYAGGGAGGSSDSGGTSSGGTGGGGNGATGRGSSSATTGASNTGGGGGGASEDGSSGTVRGKAGGSGIVIFRYTRAQVGG